LHKSSLHLKLCSILAPTAIDLLCLLPTNSEFPGRAERDPAGSSGAANPRHKGEVMTMPHANIGPHPLKSVAVHKEQKNTYKRAHTFGFITARRYMLARFMLSSCVCLSFRHKLVFYRNGLTYHVNTAIQ